MQIGQGAQWTGRAHMVVVLPWGLPWFPGADKSKHIEIKYHYIRDMVQRNAVHMQYLPTHEQIADIFTKPLARTKFEYFRERLGLVENASLAEREC
jgi:hypothetical protein